jgi:hypothetical protein
MISAELDKLRYEYTGRNVMTDGQRPELARMDGKLGCVKAVNCNLRALVQFEGMDPGWYDIDPDYLTIVDKPEITRQ